MNNLLNALLPKVQALRDETAAQFCEEMFLSDGTVIHLKEQGLALVASYDDLLDVIKYRSGVAVVDAKCPSSSGAPQSFDQ